MKTHARFLAVLAGAVLLARCGGGKSATAPTSISNLNSAPADAFTVAIPELTIKFWFELSPPRDAVIRPEDEFRITFHCRTSGSGQAMYWLRLEYEPVRPNGSVATSGPFSNYAGFNTTHCGAGTTSGESGRFGSAFAGLEEVRIQAWLQAMPQGGSATSPTGSPHGTFVFRVNWTLVPPPTLSLPLTVDFESPSLEGDDRKTISPYTSSNVTFTAEEGGNVMLARNKGAATSACVPPESANQMLGTTSIWSGEAIGGGSAFPIRATFSLPRDAMVSVVVQTGAERVARLRLFDAREVLQGVVTANTSTVGICPGNTGTSRGRATLRASANAAVASAVVDTVGGGVVFVIESFEIQ